MHECGMRVCVCVRMGVLICILHNMHIWNCYYRCSGAWPRWQRGQPRWAAARIAVDGGADLLILCVRVCMTFATVDLAAQCRPTAYGINSIEFKRKLCNALIDKFWMRSTWVFVAWCLGATFSCINAFMPAAARTYRTEQSNNWSTLRIDLYGLTDWSIDLRADWLSGEWRLL